MTQVVHGDHVTSRLVFRFRDGSVDDDTTVFSQRGVFRLISDHHIQHGPSFPKPMDILIDARTGQITSRGKDGTVRHDHLDLPPDVANGLPPNLLMNIDPATPETKLSFVAPTDKPRLIQVSIKPVGKVPFTIGDTPRQAIDYILHAELGGITGILAPIIGKQPADFHIWILGGTSPAFIREEGQLYEGGPIWRIEQISPTFPLEAIHRFSARPSQPGEVTRGEQAKGSGAGHCLSLCLRYAVSGNVWSAAELQVKSREGQGSAVLYSVFVE